MARFEEVKHLFEKVLSAIHEDRDKLTSSTSDGGREGGRITVWRLEQAADNHLFDDHPERFGITKHEGHTLRCYLESHWDDGREYIEKLHHEFPQYMDEENERYLRDINADHQRRGLPLINL